MPNPVSYHKKSQGLPVVSQVPAIWVGDVIYVNDPPPGLIYGWNQGAQRYEQSNPAPVVTAGNSFVAPDEAAMLASGAKDNDICIRGDQGNVWYTLLQEPAYVLSNWALCTAVDNTARQQAQTALTAANNATYAANIAANSAANAVSAASNATTAANTANTNANNALTAANNANGSLANKLDKPPTTTPQGYTPSVNASGQVVWGAPTASGGGGAGGAGVPVTSQQYNGNIEYSAFIWYSWGSAKYPSVDEMQNYINSGGWTYQKFDKNTGVLVGANIPVANNKIEIIETDWGLGLYLNVVFGNIGENCKVLKSNSLVFIQNVTNIVSGPSMGEPGNN